MKADDMAKQIGQMTETPASLVESITRTMHESVRTAMEALLPPNSAALAFRDISTELVAANESMQESLRKLALPTAKFDSFRTMHESMRTAMEALLPSNSAALELPDISADWAAAQESMRESFQKLTLPTVKFDSLLQGIGPLAPKPIESLADLASYSPPILSRLAKEPEWKRKRT